MSEQPASEGTAPAKEELTVSTVVKSTRLAFGDVPLEIGKSVSKSIKDYIVEAYPNLKKAQRLAKYYEIVKQGQGAVDELEGRAQRAGYTKIVGSVTKTGDFTVKYLHPRQPKVEKKDIAKSIADFLAKNPNASGRDVQRFLEASK